MNEYTAEEIALEEKLKSCPFCGSKAKLHRNLSYGKEYDAVAVSCGNPNCPVKPRTNYFTDAKFAFNDWNDRLSPANFETADAARLWALQNYLQTLEKDLKDKSKFFRTLSEDKKASKECRGSASWLVDNLEGFKRKCEDMRAIVSGNEIPQPPDLESLYELIRKLVGAARWGLENVKHARCLREHELTRPDMAEQHDQVFGNIAKSFSETIDTAQKMLDRKTLGYYETTRARIDEVIHRNIQMREIERIVFDHITKPFDPPIYTHGCEVLDRNHNVIAVCKTDPDKRIVGPETAEAMAAAMNRYMVLEYDTQQLDAYAAELRRCKCGCKPVLAMCRRTVTGSSFDTRGAVATCTTCGRTTESCADFRSVVDYWNRLFAMDKKKAKEMYGDDDQEMGGQGSQRPVPDATQK